MFVVIRARMDLKTGYTGTALDDLPAAFGDKHMLYSGALRAYGDFKFVAMRDALQRGL